MGDRILRHAMHLLVGVILLVPAAVALRTVAADLAGPRQALVGRRADPLAGTVTRDAAAAPAGMGLRVLHYRAIGQAGQGGQGGQGDGTVTPRQFADQMATLAAAGYRAVTGAQLRAHLRGRPLPPRSVLLTFDGTRGVWTDADGVLARYGFHGVVFVTTGRVGMRPSSWLSWAELRLLERSGRWELGSRTRAGDVAVPVDRAGGRAPFLAARMWLAGRQRQETEGEFDARVRADLRASSEDLVAHGLPAPALFADPSPVSRLAPPDTGTGAAVARLVTERFAARLVTVTADQAVSARQLADRRLARIAVTGATTPLGLLRRLAAVEPIPLAPMSPRLRPGLWVHGGPAARDSLFAPTRTADWTGYRVSVRVRGLAPHGAGGSGTVLALVGGAAELRVGVSGGWLGVRAGRASTLAAKRLPGRESHLVEIVVAGGRVIVAVDHRRELAWRLPPRLAPAARGGIGFAPAGAGPVFDALRVEPVTG